MCVSQADAGDSGRFDSVIETILGSPRGFSSREVAEAVGVPVYRARKFWRAFGFPNVPDDEGEFSAEDRRALEILIGLVSDGEFTENQTLRLTRILGRAGSRLANSQAETVLESLQQSDGTAVVGVPLAERLLPDLEALLVYSWRRHLSAAFHRMGPHSSQANVVVGFADLVGFTRLSRQLSGADLTHMVGGFEGTAADLVTAHGGRLVKSLGDEVLFTATAPTVAAAIALQMVEKATRHYSPGIRIGLEYGDVVKHAGDVYGETVNLASRLTAIAQPNQILVGPGMFAEMTKLSRYRLESIGVVDIRGIGELEPAVLHRSGPSLSAASEAYQH